MLLHYVSEGGFTDLFVLLQLANRRQNCITFRLEDGSMFFAKVWVIKLPVRVRRERRRVTGNSINAKDTRNPQQKQKVDATRCNSRKSTMKRRRITSTQFTLT